MDELFPELYEGEQSSPELSRRVFVKGLGLVSVGLILSTLGGCSDKLEDAIANRPMRRWLRTGSPEVDADLATYAQGVTAMKGLSDATSWANQSTIHGTAGVGFNFCKHNSDHFFDWHRVYLVNFERIIQKVTGNAKWGLPYWNWNQTPDIHQAFLDPTSVQYGALYLDRTRTSMTGQPTGAVTTPVLDPIFADTNFFTFSQQLEGTPHNTVHNYIGQGKTFGGFGSPTDPIFWAHHCMVDYCWTKWNNELGNDNTNDPTWSNFNEDGLVDANGGSMTIAAGLTPLFPLLSYQYESSAIGSSPASAVANTKSAYLQLKQRIERGANIRFDIKRRVLIAERASVMIAKPVSKETKVAAADVAAIVNSNAAQEKIFVSVEFAQLPATSDFSVRVFINLPRADVNTPQTDPHYAGSFSFFGTTPANPTSTMEHSAHQPKFLVNITETLQRLRRNQELTESQPISVQLVAVPFGGKFEREDTELVLNKIEIIITPVIVKGQQ
ncbi:MAG TPA: tyrosinase family protein [Pyrinomonadaceae bacterium]|nr:tyrosinase family protein [Pyrinomonadaceae bacterium]